MSGRRDAWESALAEELPCQELTPGEARHLLALNDLTRAGKAVTQAAVARRHAAEVLVRDILGVDEAHARSEAERLTASLSPLLARKLVAFSRGR
jgi:hypothetical protein